MLNTVLQIIGTEWIWIVFLVVFLLFGSQKLPELSRALGKAMGEFQRGREEIEREIRAAAATPNTPTNVTYTPPKIEYRDVTPATTATAPVASAAVVTAPAPATASTPAPTSVITATTTSPAVVPEKKELPAEEKPKRTRTTKRTNTTKTAGRRKKKDNSASE